MLKLTDEMRSAIEQQPGVPVKVEDEQSRKIYLLVDEENARHLIDQWLRSELQIGFDQADQGEVVQWDPEGIKAEGRQQIGNHPS